jgi:hypothetical protein
VWLNRDQKQFAHRLIYPRFELTAEQYAIIAEAKKQLEAEKAS